MRGRLRAFRQRPIGLRHRRCAAGSVQTPNWTVGGDLTVGDTATGALTIDAGATVSNDLATIGNLNGAIGTLTVSGRDGAGAASTWTSTGLVSVGVESGSQGTLKVQAGGQARSDAGIIGRDSGSVGTVTVSGVGSVWELSTINSFQIGTAGSGTLRIDDGGAVHSGQGIIGWQPGGNGRVTVTGARSVWDPLNNIYVGFEGTGELQVRTAPPSTQRPSGPTSAASIYIGLQPGGVGTVNVSSDGQRLDPEGERPHRDRLGGHGHADHRQGRDRGRRRRYLDRRRRRLDRHVAPAWRCRRSWRAGDRLRRQGAGTTSFDWNGGILRAIRDQNDFLNGFATQAIGANGAWFGTNTYDVVMGTAFSGASSFNKLGAGTLTLSGNSAAFTGNTAIRAGTLQVDGILGGPVNVLAGARLTGTGRVGATTNQGVIAPGPRSGFGTLTIAGDYAGQGGGLEVRTRLGADNSPTDKLVITGATAGATPVTVKNIGGAGAATQRGHRSCRSMASRRASSTWPTAITSSMGVRPWWPAPTAMCCNRIRPTAAGI